MNKELQTFVIDLTLKKINPNIEYLGIEQNMFNFYH